MKTGFIGGGNMAEAMIKGMTAQGMKGIMVSEPSAERRQYLGKTYGIKTLKSNTELVQLCSIIILAVKPQHIEAVLNEISPDVTEEKTVVSIAAGIKLEYLSSMLRTKRLIRVMPNTPALVREGMSVLSLCECFSDKELSTVKEIFMSIGRVITLPEKYMDVVTAVSGSGPAFIALFIETMIDAGEKMGLTRDTATELALQTLTGTAQLLDTGMSPEKLRNMVTSPGGTTEAGLKMLHDKGFTDALITAIEAAANRSRELGRGRN
jgi:pyrroline-5-carboxylate reductase